MRDMETKTIKTRKKAPLLTTIVLALSLAMAFALAGCGQQQASAPADQGASGGSSAAGITVTVSIDAKDVDKGMLFDGSVAISEGGTVIDALKATGVDYNMVTSSMGGYVDRIGDVNAADFGSTAGWMYTVNGEVAPVSADTFTLANGDKIVWTFYKDAMSAM